MEADPATRHGGLRLTSRVFTDLAIWMVGLGILIGLVFPLAIIALGIPARLTLRVPFFVATLSAGIIVAALNHLLARVVIGRRLRILAASMRHVGEVVGEVAYTGDYSRCSPESCSLEVDSADELGEAAASFNLLLVALLESHSVAAAVGTYNATLSDHLDLDDLARHAISDLARLGGAQAAALLVVRDGELAVKASLRLSGDDLGASPVLRRALDTATISVVDVPEGIHVDAALVSFRPRAVAILPLHVQGVLVGGAILAFAEPPDPEALRLLDGLRGSTSVALQNALAHERFQRLAAVDPLTGAYNRRFGLARLAEEFARSVRGSAPLGVVAFDLDHFKVINDTYGHLVGDRVLKEVVGAVRVALRQGDVLIRTGGEEFVALLPGAGLEDVRNLGEGLRRAVGNLAVRAGAGEVKVTVSLGGVAFPECRVESTEGLLEMADQALYASKEAGRDRLTVVERPLLADRPIAI